GPLLDAGHDVTLIDAACLHLSDAQTVERVCAWEADVVLIAHVGSTTAHPACLRLLRALKVVLPSIITVYGGVHPTYHYRTILAEETAVDVIVRGEGEATITALMTAFAQTANKAEALATLPQIAGIAWRSEEGEIKHTPAPALISDLEANRIGWELISDW